MPPPIEIDEEALKTLVVAIGPRAAARQMGLNENTVLAWAKRGNWMAATRPTPAEKPLPASMQPRAITAIKPSEALANTLEDDSKATKLSLSIAAKRMAREAESAGLDQARNAHEVAKLASTVHAWEAKQPTHNVMINLQILGL